MASLNSTYCTSLLCASLCETLVQAVKSTISKRYQIPQSSRTQGVHIKNSISIIIIFFFQTVMAGLQTSPKYLVSNRNDKNPAYFSYIICLVLTRSL